MKNIQRIVTTIGWILTGLIALYFYQLCNQAGLF